MGFNANILKFDKNNNVEDFTFILSTKNYKHIGKLNNVKRDTINLKENLNGANELSFEVYKVLNGNIEEHWDKIIDLKLVYIQELNEYFEIKVTYDDKLDEVKTITSTSLCEAELGQLLLYNTEINTEDDIARDDYVVTTFYNEENPKASLLNRILNDKAPHYTIEYVDKSLWNIQRTFSINGTSIYDFLTGECAEQFNCLFVFNSEKRSIRVYDLYTVCNNCGYRGEYSDVCPECGSDFLNYFGEDTSIFVNKENLSEDIKFETDTDSVKNCFRLVAGDDYMTSTITMLNQNGSSYIYYIPEEQKEDMSDELVEKIESYDKLYATYTEEYQALLQDYYDVIDDILYYTSGMMPGDSSDSGDSENVGDDRNNTKSIAEQEAEKLTETNLSPVGLTTVSTSTSVATVDSAIKNYAKIFVNTGKVKITVSESNFTYKGTDADGYNYGEWIGTLKVTNYSDEQDVAYSDQLRIKVYDNYEEYVNQKVKKDIAIDEDEYSIFNVIEIDDLDLFKEALKLYCLNRLTSFADALETALETLIGLNQSSEDAELYEALYLPYYNKLTACQDEVNNREATINDLEDKKETITSQIDEIHDILNFENYLGEELYTEFCTYRREQEYNNSNYISDGLDNAEMIENAKDFLEAAKKELIKSATRQHSISCSLYNLLAMPEFKPILDKFALGNFIRVQVGSNIYRLRLISYEINFSDLNTINVEFSDLTQTAEGKNDLKSIIDSAQSMSKSYSYVSKQAEKGQTANSTFEQMYQDGLNSALYRIKNNTNEEIIIDKGGLTARAYDDIENDYSPEQVKITHNLIAFTDNNWRSVRQALGKHNYYKFVDDNGVKLKQFTAYGLTSDFVTSGVVNGSQIIGGDIFSTNYSSTTGTHINLNDGSFTFAGGKLKYDSEKDTLNLTGKITFEGIDYSDEETKKELQDSLGVTEAQNTANNAQSLGTELKKCLGFTTEISSDYMISPYIGGGYLKITDSAKGSVVIDPKGINADYTGYIFGVYNSSNDLVMGVDTSGNGVFKGTVTTSDITATGGKIGGFTIGSSAIYNGTSSIDSTTAGVYLGTDGINLGGGAFKVTKAGAVTASNMTITGGSIAIGTTFSVSSAGVLKATGANITGTIITSDITATGGKIGGWTINSTAIYSGTGVTSNASGAVAFSSTDFTRTINSTSRSGLRFAIGSNLGITKAGYVYASNVDISGKIVATEGQIASITIQKDQGLFYSPTDNASIGFGLWATTAHANIAFHAGANNTNIGGAPFRVYHDGSVIANNLTVTGNSKIGGFKLNASAGGAIYGVIPDGVSATYRAIIYPYGFTWNNKTFYFALIGSGGTPVMGMTENGWVSA